MQRVQALFYFVLIESIYCNTTYKYCVTNACTQAAGMLLRNMNHSTDPCNDFFQFACGNWVKDNPLPQGLNYLTQLASAAYQIGWEWRESLLDPAKVYQGPIQLAKRMLEACLKPNDTEQIREPLLEFMITHGGMPLIHDPDQQNDYKCDNIKSVSSVLAANSHLTFTTPWLNAYHHPFFTLYTTKAYGGNYSTLRVSVSDAPLLYRTTDPKGLANITLEVVNHLTGGTFQANSAQVEDAKTMARFAHIIWKVEAGVRQFDLLELRVITITLGDLKRLTTFLDWNEYIIALLPEHMKDYSITDETKIETTEQEVEVFKVINEHVANFTQNNCRVIFNHIWFITIYILLGKLTMDRQIYEDFMGSKYPLDAKEQVCSKYLAEGHLDQAVGALYVQEHFSSNLRDDMENMTTSIRTEMIEILESADWLDGVTRQRGFLKAEAMQQFIAFPDMALQQNEHLLEEYYLSLSFTEPSSYFDMMNALNSFGHKQMFLVLLDPTTNKEWIMSQALVNAAYNPMVNSITVPAAIMNPPIYHVDGPKSINYGGIGYVIGHEITHGFDNMGRLFDEDGDIADWWKNISKKEFLNKSTCFENQFSELPTDYINVTLNGQNTLGENIADAGGIKMAYRAYRKYVQKLGKEEPRLPGLMHLTHNQLFFLSSAQAWCGTFNRKGLEERTTGDPHAITHFRVTMQMVNSKYFHQAFQCEKDSNLNPKQQCHVWLL